MRDLIHGFAPGLIFGLVAFLFALYAWSSIKLERSGRKFLSRMPFRLAFIVLLGVLLVAPFLVEAVWSNYIEGDAMAGAWSGFASIFVLLSILVVAAIYFPFRLCLSWDIRSDLNTPKAR